MCVLKKIPIIAFSLWCTKLLANIVRRYGQKVTLVKKWSKLHVLKELSHGLRERAPYHVILAASIQLLLCPHPALLDKAYAMFCLLTL